MGLSTLNDRRKRGDCMMIYKLLNKLEKIDFTNLLFCSVSDRRGQTLKTELVRSCRHRYNFFRNRASRHWNLQNKQVKETKSLKNFKEKYDNS